MCGIHSFHLKSLSVTLIDTGINHHPTVHLTAAAQCKQTLLQMGHSWPVHLSSLGVVVLSRLLLNPIGDHFASTYCCQLSAHLWFLNRYRTYLYFYHLETTMAIKHAPLGGVHNYHKLWNSERI